MQLRDAAQLGALKYTPINRAIVFYATLRNPAGNKTYFLWEDLNIA